MFNSEINVFSDMLTLSWVHYQSWVQMPVSMAEELWEKNIKEHNIQLQMM